MRYDYDTSLVDLYSILFMSTQISVCVCVCVGIVFGVKARIARQLDSWLEMLDKSF